MWLLTPYDPLSQATADRIQLGMTFQEVDTILRSQGFYLCHDEVERRRAGPLFGVELRGNISTADFMSGTERSWWALAQTGQFSFQQRSIQFGKSVPLIVFVLGSGGEARLHRRSVRCSSDGCSSILPARYALPVIPVLFPEGQGHTEFFVGGSRKLWFLGIFWDQDCQSDPNVPIIQVQGSFDASARLSVPCNVNPMWMQRVEKRKPQASGPGSLNGSGGSSPLFGISVTSKPGK